MRASLLAFWLALLAVSPGCATPGRVQYGHGPKAPFVILDASELQRGKVLAASGELVKALSALVNDCRWTLTQPAYSVVYHGKAAASRDAHDYHSIQANAWPDQHSQDGLPWVVRSGQTNPDATTPDKKALDNVCDRTLALALGYAYTGQSDYARHAAMLVRTFFLEPQTRMNPNLAHAQMLPGRNTGTAEGISDGRGLLRLLDATAILSQAGALGDKETAGFKGWCAQYLDWLLASRAGKVQAQPDSAGGAWYDAQVVALAVYTNRPQDCRQTLDQVGHRLEAQLGGLDPRPGQAKQTKTLRSRLSNLEAWFLTALAAERAGADLWNQTSPSGHGLRKSLDTLLPYLRGVKTWEHGQVEELGVNSLRQITFLLRLAAIKYNQPAYEQDIQAIVGEYAASLRLNLVFPPHAPRA